MKVSVVKSNPKLTIGLSPISKNRRSIHLNDIGLDESNQEDFSETEERSIEDQEKESSSEYSSSYYSEDESEISRTQNVT